MSRVLHVLAGCSAVGKTEAALRWAKVHDAEIVSCDSLLFYRGMDIGTAKPTRAELARVPHHLIDIREVRDAMDIAAFVPLARAAIAEIRQRGRNVLVVGGSGFYLKAIFGAVTDEVAVPTELRARLATELGQQGLPALVVRLESLNPGGLGKLDVHNPRRVVRALERCLVTGKTLAELHKEFAAQPGAFAEFDVRLTELVREKAELDQRIDARVRQMLRDGLVAEVQRLLPLGLKENPSAARAIGYRETIDFLEGRLTEADLAATIARNTRALVKKQRTWFKTQLPEHRRVPAATADAAQLF